MWWCYLHLWWYFLKGRVRARSDVRFQSWAKLALGWRERVHSLKNSAMTVKGVCRLCTNCLSTPKKSGKYPNQPLSYAFLVKIIMPGGLTVQKPAAGWETFSTVTKFFLLGPANSGIENFSLKRSVHCSQKVCHVKWSHGTLSYLCKARVQKPKLRRLVVDRYPPKLNRHQNFDDGSYRPLCPKAK